MAWRSNPFNQMAKSKPMPVTFYATVIIAAVVACVYVFFAFYSYSSSLSSLIWLTSDSFALTQTSSSSRSIDASVVPPQTITSKVKSKSIKPVWELPPPGSKMPDLETFRLTKELVEQRVIDNVIVVTFGNYAFMDFILTWVKHLADLGIHNFLVGALDTDLLEALYWKGVPVYDMGAYMTTVDVGWGSTAFRKMGRLKADLIETFLAFGFEILMCDTDMVWLKNPLPYFARFPEADILCSTDIYKPTVMDDSLESWEPADASCNIGMFHWRPTKSSKKIAKAWKKMLLDNERLWDQNGFVRLLRRKVGPVVDKYTGLSNVYDGHLKLGGLPASIFGGGHTFFVQAQYLQFRLEPYAVHTTYQIGGTDGKRHRFREGMFFFDPPEYYDSPGGFLTFKLSIPKSLLYDGEHNIESHFALVYYQIKKIRDAFAVASVLNRTLVMPPLWCRLDRLWFPHPGIMSGSFTQQPFLCPMDHVFKINAMLRDLPEDKFGPQIRFREYSLFENPSMPQKVKESWLDVRLCEQGSEDCQVSDRTSSNGLLKFPNHSNDEMYKSVFSAFKDVKVIQFLSMQDAFSGFIDQAQEEKFRKRMKHYISSWCCLEHTRRGGQIPFDIYWDKKDDWKPKLV